MKKTMMLALALAASGAAFAATGSKVIQSGESACLVAAKAAVSCLEPGLYARARDLASLAASPESVKSEVAQRALTDLMAGGQCATNAAMSSAAGGSVKVLRRSYKAKSKTVDPTYRAFEDEVLAEENVVSFKAPPKFKGLEYYTGDTLVRACN